MNQSTSFAQVATNLLNVLQGYTKSIRFVVVLSFLFTLSVGSVLGATYTLGWGSATGTTGTYTNFSATSGEVEDIVSFSTAKNSSQTNPAYNSNNSELRLYYASNGDGGSITLTPVTGITITGVIMKTSTTPSVEYTVDGGTATSVSASNNVYTISGISASTSLKIQNVNTTNTQLRIKTIEITYTTGSGGDSGDDSGDAGSGKCEWQLVTDVKDLEVGDRIVIAAKDYNYAISTTQNNNNRGQVAITKSNDKSTISEPSNTVQILTLETGKTSGSLAFNTGSGYLYAASSSSNYLRTETTLTNNSSWTISIASSTATITAQGLNTNNVMQYNQSSSLFACYSSASQKALVIYKEVCESNTPTYTITWKNGDAVLEMDENVEEGATPEYNGATPTKAATDQYTYTFAGWDPEISTVTKNQTYTAKFTETLRTYTITWKNGDNVLETDNNVEYGVTPQYNGATPTKAADAQYTYTFNGWNPTIEPATADATYTATFTETINEYLVTFNIKGLGTAPATQTIAYGSKVSEPSAPTADDYKFAGWYKDEQCTIPWNFNTDVITGNTAIHAKWLQIFTITWKANGLEYTTTKVIEGEQITQPAEPNPENYCGDKFVGWTTENPASGNFNEAPTVYNEQSAFPSATGNQTFYAVFADYNQQ